MDPRTYKPQDKLLYTLVLIWIVVWSITLLTSPYEHPEMLFKVPALIVGLTILIQLCIPNLRFSGLANVITMLTMIVTTGLGLILRAV